MDRDLINSLKLLVNQREWENIRSYVEWRQGELTRSLLQAQTFDEFRHIQGRIFEGDYLLKLREVVNAEEQKLLKERR